MTDDTTTPQAAKMEHYLLHGRDQVHGWLPAHDASLIAGILRHQIDTGVAGNVAEIGVHHGKLLCLLALGTRSDERAVALDVFDDQDLNVDGSGHGAMGEFLQSVSLWAPDADVVPVQKSSLDVSPGTARDTFGAVRCFSIDGGHTAEITHHDLTVAEASVVDDGVVVLDDVLNPFWLGVLTGLVDYLRSDASTLVPFAISNKKLYLATSPEKAAAWKAALRQQEPHLFGKEGVEYFGHEVDVYSQGSPVERAEQRAAADARLVADQAIARVPVLERQVSKAKQRIADLESSTSWKVTAPLRRVTGSLRR